MRAQRTGPTAIEELEKDLEGDAARSARLKRGGGATRCATRAQNRTLCDTQPIEDCRQRFADLPKVVQHLDAIQADILEDVTLFINPQATAEEVRARRSMRLGSVFDRYEVNVW